MIRIAFLGCDSTHTEAFAQRINPVGSPFYGQAKVVSIWGENPEQAAEKARVLGIERVADTPAQALVDVDLAMVIGRFGDSHYEPTVTALNAGIPTFVDKPFTVSFEQATALASLAKERGVALSSCSPLRFAKELAQLRSLMSSDKGWECVAAAVPASCTDLGPDPRLNSAFFYGIHGLEMLLELTGCDIANTHVQYGQRAISVQIEFKNGRSALFEMIRNAAEFYEIAAYTSATTLRLNVELDGSYYQDQLESLINNFAAGKPFVPLSSTVTAIELLARIERDDTFKQKAQS